MLGPGWLNSSTRLRNCSAKGFYYQQAIWLTRCGTTQLLSCVRLCLCTSFCVGLYIYVVICHINISEIHCDFSKCVSFSMCALMLYGSVCECWCMCVLLHETRAVLKLFQLWTPPPALRYVDITAGNDGNLNHSDFLKIYRRWELLSVSADKQNLVILYDHSTACPYTHPHVQPWHSYSSSSLSSNLKSTVLFLLCIVLLLF